MELIKNPFEFELAVVYADGELAKVPLAGRRPRAILVNGLAILLNDVRGRTLEEVVAQCNAVLVNQKKGFVPPQHLFDAILAQRNALNSVLEKVGGEPFRDADYVFVSGNGYVLCNPVTCEVKALTSSKMLVARPVVYWGMWF